ncbi:hypothetical protein [Sphingopyxis sp.]|uniref:hypothetical protein n=1 Tax=Sphingopyxis sp. TaxID=1908224 RepID=UPI002FC8B609
MKPLLALPFLLLALCSAPSIAQNNAVAQTEPYKGPHDDALRYIVEVSAAGIDIAPDKRGDLSGCNGVTDEGILRAIQTCWPVLETYKNLTLFKDAMTSWSKLPYDRMMADTPETRAIGSIADNIIASAGARTFPAQDIPLVAAHMAKGFESRRQKDLDGYSANLIAAREIISSSRIDASLLSRMGFNRIARELTADIEAVADLKATKPGK